MIQINVPGFGNLKLKHLVLDYNGTLAIDGIPMKGVINLINSLSKKLVVHVITADTFGKVKIGLSNVKCELVILNTDHEEKAKFDYIENIGLDKVVSIGNGRNDRLMLKKSALSIVVTHSEGLAVEALLCSNILCEDIFSALKLLLYPYRLVATLRS